MDTSTRYPDGEGASRPASWWEGGQTVGETQHGTYHAVMGSSGSETVLEGNDYRSNQTRFSRDFNGFTQQILSQRSHFYKTGTSHDIGISRYSVSQVGNSSDTSSSNGRSDYSDEDNNGTISTNSTATSSGGPATYLGASVFSQSTVSSGGYSTVTGVSTWGTDFHLSGVTSSTYTTSRATTGTTTSVSTSRWTLAVSERSDTSEQSTSVATASRVTWAADIWTFNTITAVTGTGTFTRPVTTDTLTNHLFSNATETICLMRGGREENDHHLGNMLWSFSHTQMDVSATTTGRFTDLFASVTDAVVTLPDYQKWSSESFKIHEITVSYDYITAITDTLGGTGLSRLVSMNGSPWNESDSSNVATITHTFAAGDVSYNPASNWYQTYQVTGYSVNGQWTTSSSTLAAAGFSSFSETYPALFSSVLTTLQLISRGSSAVEFLINSYSTKSNSLGTGLVFLGGVKTTSVDLFHRQITVTLPAYLADFNSAVEKYQIAETGSDFGHSTRHEEQISMTSFRQAGLVPGISVYNNYQQAAYAEIWFKCPAAGYGGFGGNFTASSLPVFFNVEIGLLSGSCFSSQTILKDNLPTVLAYPDVPFGGVTCFPVVPEFTLHIPGASSASYMGHLTDLGQSASLAVTWTSTTTTTGTPSTLLTSLAATYTLVGAEQIMGDFYKTAQIGGYFDTFYHNTDVFALGDNHLAESYDVRLYHGYFEWAEFAPGDSTSGVTSSAFAESGSVSFAIPANRGIVYTIEPIYTAQWGPPSSGNPHFFFSSTPHLPT